MRRLTCFVLLLLIFFTSPQIIAGNWFVQGDVELFYEYWPGVQPERGSLLLIHGLGGSTFSWRKISPQLAEAGYNVYAVDLPGFGRSPAKESLDLSRTGFASILWSFWSSQNPPKPLFLLGHSMGGGIALQMVGDDRENIEGLVLIAPALQEPEGGFWTYFLRFRPVRRIGGWIMGNFFLKEERVEEILSSAYRRKPTPEEFDAYYEPLAKPGALETLFKMTSDNRKSSVKPPDGVEEKTLLIWGERDDWVPPPTSEKDLEVFLNYKLEIIPGGGHLVMETHYEETIDLILNFLGGK